VEGFELPARVFATEQFQGLSLGCGGEGKITDVRLFPAEIDFLDDFIFQVKLDVVFLLGIFQTGG